MKLCNHTQIERLDCYLATKHPFITRDPKSSIPDNYMEKYNKKAKIKQFKTVKLLLFILFIPY